MTSPAKLKVAVILGTRPEVIKLSPIIRECQARDIFASVISTSQQALILDTALNEFGINPEFTCRRRSESADTATFLGEALEQIRDCLTAIRPDWVIVQGDTASAMAGALSGFLVGIPVAHVEAGLRTFQLAEPFPEEGFRQVISRLSTIHFATTAEASANLCREGINPIRVHVVGNTVADGLELHQFASVMNLRSKRILVTLHRRENFGSRMQNICKGIALFLASNPEMSADIVLHPNPNSSEVIKREFASHLKVRLLKPLNRQEFLDSMSTAACVLTDSGGVQEEAFVLGIPLVVARLRTERPEVLTGTAVIGGDSAETIFRSLNQVVNLRMKPMQTESASELYGQGRASERIVDLLLTTDL